MWRSAVDALVLLPALYPAPDPPSYTEDDFMGYLCWLPRRSGGAGAGAALPCLWFPQAVCGAVLLYFHGNGDDLGTVFQVMQSTAAQLKVSVLAVEYPGYGLLKQETPSEHGLYEVGADAMAFLKEDMGVPTRMVTVMGRSLGGSPALHLASRLEVAGLILVSAFTSVHAVAQDRWGALAGLVGEGAFANDRMIESVTCPVLIVHGAEDETVPVEHAWQLHKLCQREKRLLAVAGRSHNTLLVEDFADQAKELFCWQKAGGAPSTMPARAYDPHGARLQQGPSPGAATTGCSVGFGACYVPLCWAQRQPRQPGSQSSPSDSGATLAATQTIFDAKETEEILIPKPAAGPEAQPGPRRKVHREAAGVLLREISQDCTSIAESCDLDQLGDEGQPVVE